MSNHPNRSRRYDTELFVKLDADLALMSAVNGIRKAYSAIPDEGHKKYSTALCQLIMDAGYPAIPQEEAEETLKADSRNGRIFIGAAGGMIPLPWPLCVDLLLKLERKLSAEGKL